MSAPPKAKLQPWKAIVNGVTKIISVLASDVVDLTAPQGYQGTYDNKLAYAAGVIVRVETQDVVNGVTLTPGVHGAIVNVEAGASGVGIPQWPQPAGANWILIAFGIKTIGTCFNGNEQININASDPF